MGGTQLPIAIARFRDEDRTGQSPSAIIRADLERSGAFRGIDNSASLDETSQPVWGEWRARTADALVAGSAARLADGRFDLRFKLWDVVKGADLGGQSNAVEAAEVRLGAHRIADYVYEKLTGEKGVFSTRIAYVTAGRLAAHAPGRRCRRRQRPGRAQQRPADHLAGLVAERQGARLRLVREAEGGGVRAQRRHRRAPGDRRLPRLEQRARPGRTTARRWR